MLDNMSLSQLQDYSLYRDEEWGKVRTTIVKQFIEGQKSNLLGEQILIQQQNELLQQIKEKIRRSKMKDSLGNLQVLPIDSSLSNISSHYNYADDQSLIKNKFAEEFQSSLVNSALKEVKSQCSDETYETVRNYVLNNKQKQYDAQVKFLQKKNKEIEQLSFSLIMKQNQVQKLKEEIAPLASRAEYFEDQKKKWKRKGDQLMQKELLLHKMEKALIFKEKMHQQAKKRGERLKQFTDNIYIKMKGIQNQLNQLRMDIQSKMSDLQSIKCCPEGKECWKKDIMKKFREKLLQQRSILKQEERHLQKRYEILENVSEQCKKLVSESYEGLLSSANGGSAITINTKEQKSEKNISMSVIAGSEKRIL